jgi:glycerol-3-phosphate dehydrogenase
VPPSCTRRIPLLGTEGYDAAWNARHRTATGYGIHVAWVEHLLQRCGSLATEVLDLCTADSVLAEALSGADDYLAAKVVYAASHEGARHLVSRARNCLDKLYTVVWREPDDRRPSWC